jgi:hypothetical protein
MRRNPPTNVYSFTKGVQGMPMHTDSDPVRARIEEDEYDECADAEEDPFAAREDKAPSPTQDATYMASDSTRMLSPSPPARTLSYANPSYKPPQQQHQPAALFRTAAEVASGDECTQSMTALVHATCPSLVCVRRAAFMHACPSRVSRAHHWGGRGVWCATGSGRIRVR